MAADERCDVYIQGTLDPSAEAVERAARGAAEKLAVSPQQLAVLLRSPKPVRVRTEVAPDLAFKIVSLLRGAGVRAAYYPAGTPKPVDLSAAPDLVGRPVTEVTTGRVRAEVGGVLAGAATGEFDVLLAALIPTSAPADPEALPGVAPPPAAPPPPGPPPGPPPAPRVARMPPPPPPVEERMPPPPPPVEAPPPASALPPAGVSRQRLPTPSPRAATDTSSQSLRGQAFRVEVEARARELDRLDHFALLGVPRAAGPQEIRLAYLGLARSFHPDRATSLGVEDLRPQLERIFARITEAHAVLTTPDGRAAYERALDGGGCDEAAAEVENALDAERAFQMGEHLLKQKQYARAEACFERAATVVKDVEHELCLAWARYNNPANSKDQMRATLMATLARAAKERPHLGRIHRYAGEVYLGENVPDKAVKAFQRAVQLDPEDVEAQRGLRLAQARVSNRESRPFWKK